MGIRLLISGGGEGDALDFDGPEVTIGRTADNDVVLNDPSVSRRHAKLKLVDDAWLVEDLGSGNGTIVNGEKIEGEAQVGDGDTLTVGPVTFTVEAEAEAAPDPIEAAGTRMVDARAIVPSKRGSNGKAALVGRRGQGGSNAMTAQQAPVRGGRGALAARGAGGAIQPASARARARRAQSSESPLTRFADWLRTRPLPVRVAIFGFIGLGVLLAVGVAINKGRAGGPTRRRDKSKEVFTSAVSKADADTKLYGVGDNADVLCADKCNFSFDFVEPARNRARAVVHYTPCNIGKEREVQVLVNDNYAGEVPMAPGGCLGEQSLTLPYKHLKSNASNVVTFDNRKNPPEERSWYVSKVWVETEAIPEPNFQVAQAKYDLGMKAWQLKDVSADNMYQALKYFKEARLNMEALEPKPDLYDATVGQIKEVEQALEKTCSKMIFSANRYFQTGDNKKAEAELKAVQKTFGPDHHCYQDAQDLLDNE